jgi:hypothetical protein
LRAYSQKNWIESLVEVTGGTTDGGER